jgi:hypothetical protein
MHVGVHTHTHTHTTHTHTHTNLKFASQVICLYILCKPSYSYCKFGLLFSDDGVRRAEVVGVEGDCMFIEGYGNGGIFSNGCGGGM